jgi:hypothetical protein
MVLLVAAIQERVASMWCSLNLGKLQIDRHGAQIHLPADHITHTEFGRVFLQENAQTRYRTPASYDLCLPQFATRVHAQRYVQPVFETLRTTSEDASAKRLTQDRPRTMSFSPFYLTISMFHRATHCHEDSGLLTGTLLMRKLVLRCFIMERKEKGK